MCRRTAFGDSGDPLPITAAILATSASMLAAVSSHVRFWNDEGWQTMETDFRFAASTSPCRPSIRPRRPAVCTRRTDWRMFA